VNPLTFDLFLLPSQKLFCLTNLRKLTISENDLNRIPPGIANLTHLVELDLSKNGKGREGGRERVGWREEREGGGKVGGEGKEEGREGGRERKRGRCYIGNQVRQVMRGSEVETYLGCQLFFERNCCVWCVLYFSLKPAPPPAFDFLQ